MLTVVLAALGLALALGACAGESHEDKLRANARATCVNGSERDRALCRTLSDNMPLKDLEALMAGNLEPLSK